MEIKEENLLKALNTGSETVKETILALFPELEEEMEEKTDMRPVTERIKTFEDACRELGESHPYVQTWNSIYQGGENDYDLADHIAYMKLRIICAALNEGWAPHFTEDEWRYYPWFWLYTEDEIENMDDDEKADRRLVSTGEYQTDYAGFACANSSYAPSYSNASFGSRLCLKSDTLAVYCGKQFINIWVDFILTKKTIL